MNIKWWETAWRTDLEFTHKFCLGEGETPCLHPSGLPLPNTREWAVITTGEAGKIQGQDTDRFGVWQEPTSWFIDSCLLTASSHRGVSKRAL